MRRRCVFAGLGLLFLLLPVLLVQDAEPRSNTWLSALVQPLMNDERLAGSFSRQVPRSDASP